MSGQGKGGAFGGAGKSRFGGGGKGTAVPNSSGTRGVGARRHRYVELGLWEWTGRSGWGCGDGERYELGLTCDCFLGRS